MPRVKRIEVFVPSTQSNSQITIVGREREKIFDLVNNILINNNNNNKCKIKKRI